MGGGLLFGSGRTFARQGGGGESGQAQFWLMVEIFFEAGGVRVGWKRERGGVFFFL